MFTGVDSKGNPGPVGLTDNAGVTDGKNRSPSLPRCRPLGRVVK